MSGETDAVQNGNDAQRPEEAQARQRSSISFPYTDLQAALAVANAIHGHVGIGDCSAAQLAAWLNQSVKSSGFRIQLSAARLFGVLENEGSERHRLTGLGRRVVDPNQSRRARAEAFLNVPLFRALFDNHRDGVLPPSAALEREIADLGVAQKQKDRARQVFERSAEQAGFFEHGPNRLVEPAVREGITPSREPAGDGGGGSGGGGSGEGLALDPLLMPLLKRIPPASEGWPIEKRVRWLRTFVMNLAQLYEDDETVPEIEIESGGGKSTKGAAGDA